MNKLSFHIINIIKCILLFCFIFYWFISLYKFSFTLNISNIILMAQEIIHHDWFLKNWDLSYCSNLFTHIYYYLIPVKFFGTTNAGATIAIYTIYITAIVSGIFLIKDNTKDINFTDILLFICFLGMSKPLFESIMENGAYIPFVFLILYFSNKFLKSEKIMYLILTSIFAIMLIFGDVLSILLCVIPIIVYCLISIFYNSDSYKKYLELLIAIIFTAIIGILLYSQYCTINGSSLYGYLNSQHFSYIYSSGKYLSNLSLLITNIFLNFQNANFIHQKLLSFHNLFCFYKLIIILFGLIISFKNIHNTFCNKKEKNDYISFVLSFSLICIFAFIFYADIRIEAYTTLLFVIVPFSLAIIILRYTNCFKNLLPLKRNIILISSITIMLLFTNWNIKEHYTDFKNNFDLRHVPIVFMHENTPCTYIRRK